MDHICFFSVLGVYLFAGLCMAFFPFSHFRNPNKFSSGIQMNFTLRRTKKKRSHHSILICTYRLEKLKELWCWLKKLNIHSSSLLKFILQLADFAVLKACARCKILLTKKVALRWLFISWANIRCSWLLSVQQFLFPYCRGKSSKT